MSLNVFVRGLVLAGAAALAAASGAVVAAEADVALIKSYVGDWRGRGQIVWGGSGDQESILCRMSVQDSAPAKIGVDGRCSLAGVTLNMLGTIAYVEQNSRYEAIVSSNSAFSGIAIGHRSGDDLTFELRDYEVEENAKYDISAQIDLLGDDIRISMRISATNSPDVTSASIPFERR